MQRHLWRLCKWRDGSLRWFTKLSRRHVSDTQEFFLARSRPRGRRRLLEAEQACSSLTRSLPVVCCLLCPCLFSWHLGVLGGATGRMWP